MLRVAPPLLGLLILVPFAAAEERKAPQPIVFERQVIEFAPTRDDLTVGTAIFSVLAPDKDWTVKLEPGDKTYVDVRDTTTVLGLKLVEKNRFELPKMTIEPAKDAKGAVCLGVKVWFNELPNEYDGYFYVDLPDRYSRLSWVSRAVPEAEHHFSQNRVATLEEFREQLKKPIVMNLRDGPTPWRPVLYSDRDGTLYFRSVMSAGYGGYWGSAHYIQHWKLSPDGKLTELAQPNFSRPVRWPERMREFAQDRMNALVAYVQPEPIAAGPDGAVFIRDFFVETPLNAAQCELIKVSAEGEKHVIAGSGRGHKDRPGKEALFTNITSIAAAPSGDVYVADAALDGGSWIRRVAPDGTVTAIAGSEKLGFADGKGEAARFMLPSQIALDAGGNLYIADPLNARIRKVTVAGEVTTVAGGKKEGDEALVQPSGIAVGKEGQLFILDGGQQMARVRKMSADGKLQTLAVVDVAAARKALGK